MEELTDEEIVKIDNAMNEHMRGHAISNNVLSWTCDTECRREGLRRAINRVIKEKQANMPCTTCDGTGRWYPGMDLDDIDCPRCNGTGKVRSSGAEVEIQEKT